MTSPLPAPLNLVFKIDLLFSTLQGKEVQICIEGKLNATSNLQLPIEAPFGLKNSAHGQVIDNSIIFYI